jgi:hypothetical protein
MKQSELIQFIEQKQKEGLEIIKKKNCDYGANDDCFANFRMFGELGILVRLGDKLSRLKTTICRGSAEVKDETIEDTIMDLCNYGQLLLAYRKEQNDIHNQVQV